MTYSKNPRSPLEYARYDPDTGTYHLRSDGAEQISTNIALAVAELTGVDPLEMEPLYHSVDPDILDGFVERPPRSSTGQLSFDFQGYRVTVHADGHVHVSPE